LELFCEEEDSCVLKYMRNEVKEHRVSCIHLKYYAYY